MSQKISQSLVLLPFTLSMVGCVVDATGEEPDEVFEVQQALSSTPPEIDPWAASGWGGGWKNKGDAEWVAENCVIQARPAYKSTKNLYITHKSGSSRGYVTWPRKSGNSQLFDITYSVGVEHYDVKSQYAAKKFSKAHCLGFHDSGYVGDTECGIFVDDRAEVHITPYHHGSWTWQSLSPHDRDPWQHEFDGMSAGIQNGKYRTGYRIMLREEEGTEQLDVQWHISCGHDDW